MDVFKENRDQLLELREELAETKAMVVVIGTVDDDYKSTIAKVLESLEKVDGWLDQACVYIGGRSVPHIIAKVIEMEEDPHVGNMCEQIRNRLSSHEDLIRVFSQSVTQNDFYQLSIRQSFINNKEARFHLNFIDVLSELEESKLKEYQTLKKKLPGKKSDVTKKRKAKEKLYENNKTPSDKAAEAAESKLNEAVGDLHNFISELNSLEEDLGLELTTLD